MTKQQLLLFRSFTSFVFIYAGTKHLIHPGTILKRITSSRAYAIFQHEMLFQSSIFISGMVMVLAGIALLAGYKARTAAALLLSMLIPITLSVQLENLDDLGPFFKNVAIAGSLLFIIKYKSNEENKSGTNAGGLVHRPGIVCTEKSNA